MINPFKKKSEWEKEQDKVDKERVESIRHKAELEERLKLADEHGRFDAQKKYGRFKQSGGGFLGMLSQTAQGAGKVAKKINTKDVGKRIEKMSKDLENW